MAVYDTEHMIEHCTLDILHADTSFFGTSRYDECNGIELAYQMVYQRTKKSSRNYSIGFPAITSMALGSVLDMQKEIPIAPRAQ